MTRSLVYEIDGETYYGTVGNITRTELGIHEHYGIFESSLLVEWKGGGISTGGYVLDKPGDKNREGTAYGMDFITKTLKTVGVDRWEDIKGKKIVVLFKDKLSWGTSAVGIANIDDENNYFVYAKWTEDYKKENADD